MNTRSTSRVLSAIGFASLAALAGCASDGDPDRAGSDAGLDAGLDAGSDAGLDAGSDAGLDAGLDAGSFCGDGILDSGERCDDADDSLGAYCSDDCKSCDWDVTSLTFPIPVASSGAYGDVIFDADCNLLVSGGAIDTISQITPTGAVTTFASAYTHGPSFGLAYDLSTQTLYVSTVSPNALWAIDSLGAATKVMDLPDLVNDIEFAPAGFGDKGGALFGVGPNGMLYLFDLSTPQSSVFSSTSGHLASLAFAPDGSALYIANFSIGKVQEVDSSGTFSDLTTLLSGIDGLAMDPNGDRLIATHAASGGTLSEISIPEGVITSVNNTPTIEAGLYITGLVMDGSGDALIKDFDPMENLPSVESYTF